MMQAYLLKRGYNSRYKTAASLKFIGKKIRKNIGVKSAYEVHMRVEKCAALFIKNKNYNPM